MSNTVLIADDDTSRRLGCKRMSVRMLNANARLRELDETATSAFFINTQLQLGEEEAS